MRRMTLLSCLLSLLLATLSAKAQETETETEKRFKAMEERIHALETEVQTLKAAQASTAPAPTTTVAVPPASAQTPVGLADHHAGGGQLPVYGGGSASAKLLNSDIGIIGNFVGAAGRNTINPPPSSTLQESELSVQAIVDPYARADFFLAFGDQGVEVEAGCRLLLK